MWLVRFYLQPSARNIIWNICNSIVFSFSEMLTGWLLLGVVMWCGVMLALISSLYHSGHTGHYCPDVLGPLLCCSIKQLGYYVLNWLVLLLIMPSCCKGGWMATHLTCITTIIRTQHSQREDRSTRTLHTPTQTVGSDFKQENQNQRLLYLQQGRVGTKYIRPE